MHTAVRHEFCKDELRFAALSFAFPNTWSPSYFFSSNILPWSHLHFLTYVQGKSKEVVFFNGIFPKADIYVSTSAKSEREEVHKMQSFKTKASSDEQQNLYYLPFSQKIFFWAKKNGNIFSINTLHNVDNLTCQNLGHQTSSDMLIHP